MGKCFGLCDGHPAKCYGLSVKKVSLLFAIAGSAWHLSVLALKTLLWRPSDFRHSDFYAAELVFLVGLLVQHVALAAGVLLEAWAGVAPALLLLPCLFYGNLVVGLSVCVDMLDFPDPELLGLSSAMAVAHVASVPTFLVFYVALVKYSRRIAFSVRTPSDVKAESPKR